MDRDSLAEALESREKEILDFSVEFEKIENNLLAIDSNKARILVMHDKNDFLGRRDRINALIADIYIALDQNESAIQILERRLAAEKSRNDFAKVVVVLRKSLKEKVEEIQKLEKEISDLRLQVNNLKEAIAFKESLLATKDTLLAQNEAKIRKQQALLSEKEQQLNRAYLIKGTTKELIKAGIVIRKGGILWTWCCKSYGTESAGHQPSGRQFQDRQNCADRALYKAAGYIQSSFRFVFLRCQRWSVVHQDFIS